MSFFLMVLQHAADLLLDLDRESGQISRPRMTQLAQVITTSRLPTC
jgi:hypothetical protein